MSEDQLTDYQQAILRAFNPDVEALRFKSPSLAVLIDEVDSSTTYVGKAEPGTATTSPSWQISKISVSGTVTAVEWADGDRLFDNIWSLRTSLTYS